MIIMATFALVFKRNVLYIIKKVLYIIRYVQHLYF